jgi:hypothetical protein
MQTFKAEIRTLLFALRGSPWAAHAEVQEVISEYNHFENAGKTPTSSRRVSLQIFHASRAIDSYLAHLRRHEEIKSGRTPPTYSTLGASLRYIQRNGIGGQRFSLPVENDIRTVKGDRNTYLHRANCFPTDGIIKLFLNRTIRAINEATTFPT